MEGLNTAIDRFDYEQLNNEIKRTMKRSARDIVQIGYMLRRMMDEKLWQSEYSCLDDYLSSELGIDYTMATRMVKINKKYSIGGNSMYISEAYANYSQGLLIEMLNMPKELEEKVNPDMTVKQVRQIKKDAKKKEEPVPVPEQKDTVIDAEYREVDPEPVEEKVATSQYPDLIKPDEKQRDYLNAFAKRFISVEHDWLLDDYYNRVMNVENSPFEIRNRLDKYNRTWYFDLPSNRVAKINLFDDYVQIWDENNNYLGDFDWFYLAAAIQSMWNVVAMDATKSKNKSRDEESDTQDDELKRLRKLLDSKSKELGDWMKVAESEEIPEDVIYEKKTIVGALASMLCELEDMQEKEESDEVIEPEKIEQPELPILKNNDQRKEWLADYKAWGLWYRDENIDVNYYKYDFQDGSRLVVAEYPNRHCYWSDKLEDEIFYHLLEKNKKSYKKTYDELYRHRENTETYLVEFLKNLQKRK